MCGIFGLINFDNSSVEMSQLRIMADKMTHRGPDDEGFWKDNNVAIGMRRLSIIDVEGGHQPITNEAGDIHLVMNGEIYNYKELRLELIEKGHKFSSNSDVEVIIHLYEEMGTDCIHKLNGMFAFSLFDQSKKRMWIARDRLGIKPLYYYNNNEKFVFSSDLNSLNAVIKAEFDLWALTTYLGYSYIPAPLTPYQNIVKLMPGEQLIIEDGAISKKQYWLVRNNEDWEGGIEEAKNELKIMLEESMKLEMRSDVPLGVFLSGGVDSSALAALAAKSNSKHKIRTFTINFMDKKGEDSHYAKKVNDHIKAEPFMINVTAEEQFNALKELIVKLDEPMSDSAIVPTYIISREARNQGVLVLLSGAGGDEIFGGYPRHFPGQIGSASWFSSLPWVFRNFLSPFWILFNSALKIRLSSAANNFAVMISGANLELLRKSLISNDHFTNLLKMYSTSYAKANSKKSYPLMKMDLYDYLPNNVLALTDKASMAASIEVRVPLIDHRLVELAFSFPEDVNIFNGDQKGLFKEVLGPLLPKGVISRKKEGFNAPVHLWVENWLDEIHEELFENTSDEIKKIINMSIVRKWFDKPRLRKKASETLYSLYVLNRWIRTRDF